jgi:DNA-directed RNA polymerase subunit N (RpoN/RPB10)
MKCPTCRKLLGDAQLIYEQILDQICKDEDLKVITPEEAKKLKMELVNSFDIKTRYCCKPRFMTYKRLIDIIK